MITFLLYALIVGAGVGVASQRILPPRTTATWVMMLSGTIGSFLAS
jgi:hypothetical protein